MSAAAVPIDEPIEQTCYRLLMENDRLRVVNEAADAMIYRLTAEIADARATRQAPSDDVLQAKLSRAVAALGALVKQLERGQFMTPQEQAELRIARAVIAEER